MKLRVTSFKRTMNGELLEGYRISREDIPVSEYAYTRTRLDGHIIVENPFCISANQTYMHTDNKEEANRKLKKIVKKRLEELAKELNVERPTLSF